MTMMKVLNLYAGVGGNRKHWDLGLQIYAAAKDAA